MLVRIQPSAHNRISNIMATSKRQRSMSDCVEALSGKQRRVEIENPLSLTNSLTLHHQHISPPRSYSKPQLDFVSLLTCIPDFRHGLIEVGGLSPYDYTRLRLTSRTVADLFKPYPRIPTQPDTKDPYFAGLKPVKCDDCPNTSDSVAVSRCYSRYHPGVFSGCNKWICIRCVDRAQQSYDHHKSPETELYYCRPCSRSTTIRNQLRSCDCGLTHREDIHQQPYSDWQCMACRATQYRVLNMQARSNLENLEATNQLLPRDRWAHKSRSGMERWIYHHEGVMNRNHCPGCGRACKALQGAFATRGSGIAPLPQGMIRQCAVCFGRRP